MPDNHHNDPSGRRKKASHHKIEPETSTIRATLSDEFSKWVQQPSFKLIPACIKGSYLMKVSYIKILILITNEQTVA
jgi:hypothetical protein